MRNLSTGIITVLAAGTVGFGGAAALRPLLTTPVSYTTASAQQQRHPQDTTTGPGRDLMTWRAVARVHTEHWKPPVVPRNNPAEPAATTTVVTRKKKPAPPPPAAAVPAEAGTESPAQLAALWEAAGGPASVVNTAVCIAEHESGGRAGVLSPTDDAGLWQINVANAPTQEMMNPAANAREAVLLYSRDGWSPWNTAPDCGV